jgi:hypothetical protein
MESKCKIGSLYLNGFNSQLKASRIATKLLVSSAEAREVDPLSVSGQLPSNYSVTVDARDQQLVVHRESFNWAADLHRFIDLEGSPNAPCNADCTGRDIRY